MKKIALLLIVACLMAGLSSVVFATNSTQKLEITSLKAYVDGRSSSVDDGDTISKEAKPGSKVEFKIELTNGYTDEEKLKIEDITVTATIAEIDDGDDLDSDVDIEEIKPEKDKAVTFTFEVPYLVEQDTYDIDVEVEGEDENGTDQSFSWTFYLDVEKEKNQLVFTKAALENEALKCGDTASLNIAILNIGEEDEEDVKLDIKNSDLGIDLKDTFSLEGDTVDEEAEYSKTFEIKIPKDAKQGEYPVPIKAVYNDGSSTETKTVTMSIGACPVVLPPVVLGCIDSTALNYNSAATKDDGSCEYEEEASEEEAAEIPEAVPITGGVFATPFSAEQIAVVSLIVLGAVLVIVLVIFLVVKAARKKQ